MTVVLVGAPTDENSSHFRGASRAPAEIRRALWSGSSNYFSESMIPVLEMIEDAGDLEIGALSGEDQLEAIEQGALALIGDDRRVLTLGGDHTVTWPLVRAHVDKYGPLNIVHVDAHPDLYDEFEGSRLSHACPFARIMEEGLARRLVQIGIRTNTPHQAQQAERFGVETVDMVCFRGGVELDFDGPVYLTIDLDGLDPAFAPGVSHHEAGGLTSREVIGLVQSLASVQLVGADLVEYNPTRDVGDVTAALCGKLVKEIAAALLSAGASD